MERSFKNDSNQVLLVKRFLGYARNDGWSEEYYELRHWNDVKIPQLAVLARRSLDWSAAEWRYLYNRSHLKDFSTRSK
ncbi:hypothetical protein ASF92_09175 [Pedobacter sp. Leaf176]|nr:hypothetical protein ASF92_09175 [Pedobacter sp. Leaf176]